MIHSDDRQNHILSHWATNDDVVILKDQEERILNHQFTDHDLVSQQYEVKRNPRLQKRTILHDAHLHISIHFSDVLLTLLSIFYTFQSIFR